jgi:hypothetical protein
MPTDLDETTPVEPLDPVTPLWPETGARRASSGSVPPPVLPPAPPPAPPPAARPPSPLTLTSPPILAPPLTPLPHVAPPIRLAAPEDDADSQWGRDTYVEMPAAGTEATAILPGPPERARPVPAPTAAAPFVGPPVVAPPVVGPPRLKLRTKLVAAGIGMIIAALIIRAATHHTPAVDPPTSSPRPGLPPP